MSITERLLRVFRVDQQLDGLQSRLGGAQRFYDEQTRQLQQIDARREAITRQLRQIQTSVADSEGEMARIDARIEKLREQMNSAKTNKEYKALLTEVNTLKADREKIETGTLEQMTRSDELKKQLEELDSQRTDRERMQHVAAEDREKKADEIKDRLKELQAQRDQFAAEVPADVMQIYTALLANRGDEAMAPVEELDRRRHEYTCGACQMAVPVETVSTLISGTLSGAPITRCVSCGSILYLEKEAAESLQPKNKRTKAQVSEPL